MCLGFCLFVFVFLITCKKNVILVSFLTVFEQVTLGYKRIKVVTIKECFAAALHYSKLHTKLESPKRLTLLKLESHSITYQKVN